MFVLLFSCKQILLSGLPPLVALPIDSNYDFYLDLDGMFDVVFIRAVVPKCQPNVDKCYPRLGKCCPRVLSACADHTNG